MNVIGIDVARGKSKCALIIVDLVDKYFEIKHNRSGFSRLYNIARETKSLIVFETTGVYSSQLTQFCIQEDLDFLELNPLEASIRMAGLRRDKTDRSDSEKLAFLAINQHNLLVGRRPWDSSYEELRMLGSRYFQVTKESARSINHLHAALERVFPELNDVFDLIKSTLDLRMIELFTHPDFVMGQKIDDMVEKVWSSVNHKIHHDLVVQKCEEVWHASRSSYPAVESDSILVEITQSYCNEIRNFNAEKNSIKKKMINLARKEPELKIINSIPGAGELSVALLIGYVGDIRRFLTYKQMNAFVGIDLHRIQSGGLKNDHINRRGQKNARYIMFDMVGSMLRNQATIDNHIVDYYYKLKKGPHPKSDMVAMIACINRLNRTIVNLVRTNQIYDYFKTAH